MEPLKTVRRKSLLGTTADTTRSSVPFPSRPWGGGRLDTEGHTNNQKTPFDDASERRVTKKRGKSVGKYDTNKRSLSKKVSAKGNSG